MPDGESMIGVAMRWFVVVSCLAVAVGVLLTAMRIGSYDGLPSTLAQVCSSNAGRADPSIGNLLAELGSFNPLAFIEAGVLILLATPFFRVAAGAVMFASRKDSAYLAISVFVFGVLLFAAFVVGPMEAGG